MKCIFHKYIPVPLFLLLLNRVDAQQPCNDDIIIAVKGKWTKRPDANMQAGNQSQVISRIDKMQQLLQAAYPQPAGIEAGWYRSMGGNYSSLSKGSVAYDLNALFKTYYCNTNLKKMMLSGETGNWFYIWANKFSWFAQKGDDFLVDNQPVYLLTKKLGERDGFSVFAGIHNGVSNTGTSFSRAILIHRPGQLPYTPVSRQQYLSNFLKIKETDNTGYIDRILKMPVRSDAEDEVFKKQQLDIVVNRAQNEPAKEKAKVNFLKGYKTAKQLQQENITRVNDIYRRDIKAAQDYLANTTSEELAKPAILESNYYGYFRKFAGDKEGNMMVQLNSHYFNTQLPAHVPQFLVVYWSWNMGKPSLDFAGQIETHFNLMALQAMLDK